jgi:hypothetical protein
LTHRFARQVDHERCTRQSNDATVAATEYIAVQHVSAIRTIHVYMAFTCVEPNVHMGTRIIHHDRLATSTRTTNTSIIVDDFGIEAETNAS